MKLLQACLAVALWSTGSSSVLQGQATVDTSVVFNIVNVNSGYPLGIQGASQTAGAAAYQLTSDGSANQKWHFVPAGNSEYHIVNANTGQVLGIASASTNPGAAGLQWADNGTNDHLWKVVSVGNGQYKLLNSNSNLVLGVSNASQSPNQPTVQWTDNGTSDHLWRLTSAGGSWPGPGGLSGNVVPVADPSIVKAGSIYHLFATGGPIQERDSTDRSNFTSSNPASAFSAIPGWAASYNSADLWAPDVSDHNGTYRMYYAVSKFGTSTSAIGLATSASAASGSWNDSGSAVLTSSTCSGANAIDPGLIVDSSGNWWLSFGSFFGGIKMIAIDPNTGRQLGSNTSCYSLANRLSGSAIEGAYVYPHGGYYYLFASIDACCNSTSSTYHVIVGRSSSANGPFYDRGGLAMTQGGGTIILATHGNIIGPGGQSVFADSDGDIFVYHYYDGNNSGYPTLGINRLAWSGDGWPSIN